MKKHLTILYIVAIALALRATAADAQWPSHGDAPYEWPEGADGYQVIRDRFNGASATALGSKDDIEQIKKAVVSHMKHPKAQIKEVRWISPSLVMISSSWYTGPLAAASYYYVLEKNKEQWIVKTYYLLSIS